MTTNVTAKLTNAGCAMYDDHAPLTLQPPQVQPKNVHCQYWGARLDGGTYWIVGYMLAASTWQTAAHHSPRVNRVLAGRPVHDHPRYAACTSLAREVCRHGENESSERLTARIGEGFFVGQDWGVPPPGIVLETSTDTAQRTYLT